MLGMLDVAQRLFSAYMYLVFSSRTVLFQVIILVMQVEKHE